MTPITYYSVLNSIKSIDDLRSIFPDGKADSLNWCFLSTNGVHGHGLTLDDWAEADDLKNDPYKNLTVLVLKPRICQLLYGLIDVAPGDEAWLRRLVQSTVDMVAANAVGNLPVPLLQ